MTNDQLRRAYSYAALVFILALWVLVSTLEFNWQHASVEEDHPEWNCHTMGNQICGPE